MSVGMTNAKAQHQINDQRDHEKIAMRAYIFSLLSYENERGLFFFALFLL